jgi:putative DNA primase/helicase
MVALVEHGERGPAAIHATYLRADGCSKASIPQPKAMFGPVGGGAVRLGIPRAGAWLAVGEGIETVLAVVTACEIPGWAALSEGGIRALVLPPEATHVLMCADHDQSGVGQRAASDAGQRWLTEGRRVRIAMPPDPNTDMADVLSPEPSIQTMQRFYVG